MVFQTSNWWRLSLQMTVFLAQQGQKSWKTNSPVCCLTEQQNNGNPCFPSYLWVWSSSKNGIVCYGSFINIACCSLLRWEWHSWGYITFKCDFLSPAGDISQSYLTQLMDAFLASHSAAVRAKCPLSFLFSQKFWGKVLASGRLLDIPQGAMTWLFVPWFPWIPRNYPIHSEKAFSLAIWLLLVYVPEDKVATTVFVKG